MELYDYATVVACQKLISEMPVDLFASGEHMTSEQTRLMVSSAISVLAIREPAPTPPEVHFVITNSLDGESFVAALNGNVVATANHDDNGWAGMDSVREIIQSIANVLDGVVSETEAEE